jgi:lysozyme
MINIVKKILIILLLAVSVTAQNKITPVGLSLIEYFEGFKSKAYLCPAKVWTYGFGETEGVRPGMTITKSEAELLLKNKSVIRFERHVNNSVERSLRWHEFDALVCFSYNVGYRISGVLKQAIDVGNTKIVVMKISQCNHAKGSSRILPGLVKRRKAETSLYKNQWFRISFN